MGKQDFIKIESDNYNFYIKKDSVAERDIEDIIALQEESYQAIVSLFDLKEPFKINYFLLDDATEVGNIYGELYGDYEPCNGFADSPNNIYAVYNETVKCVGPHEDAHILSYRVNKPGSVFIREGLAMYFDEFWWGKPNRQWVREFLEDGSFVSIDKLLNDDNFYALSDALTYPIAGAFTEFLIKTFGEKNYLEFYQYQGTDFPAEIARVYHRSLPDLEAVFKEFVMA